MATLTISLSGSAVVTGSKSWTISDADVQSLVNYLLATKATVGTPALTAQQALGLWVQSFVDKTKSDVQNYQRAQDAIPPIVFT